MTSGTAKTNKPVRKKNRTVVDSHGQSYELTGCIGDGGQGTGCSTNYPNILVKVARNQHQEQSANWLHQIKRLMRQPLAGLPIAHPVAVIVPPKSGYVMQLMDGLRSLSSVLQQSMDEGEAGYLKTGGLQRRLRILARLASVLAQLHGRGLAYGDLSPANIFISESLAHSQVWLIDADNIITLSRDSSQSIYTPDYGAPEILRGESGINTQTDSWSFAVIAWQMLTLAHPLKGDVVLDVEPELESAALRGQLPWVDHPSEQQNALTQTGLPRDMVLNAALRALFDRQFNPGLHDPSARPSMAEWAEALALAAANCLLCAECGSSFFYHAALVSPFCDHVPTPHAALRLQQYDYMPVALLQAELGPEIPLALIEQHCWQRCNQSIVLQEAQIELKALPPGSALYVAALPLCRLRLAADGLWIEPGAGAHVSLQRADAQKAVAITSPYRLKAASRTKADFLLHLGAAETQHDVWRFTW